MAAAPKKLTVRTYQVGFGDCSLLTFHYEKAEKHVLLDFGSARLPRGKAPKAHLLAIAKDIQARVGKDLLAVVATNRHQDHISGFATNDGSESGDIIRACKPRFVLMPWTEEPGLARARSAPGSASGAKAFAHGLSRMQEVAGFALEAVSKPGAAFGPTFLNEIKLIAQDNLPNESALKNLATMGKGKPLYLAYGKRASALERALPGVKIQVLGPPRLAQSASTQRQATLDPDAFWHLQSLAGEQAVSKGKRLFPRHEAFAHVPPDARWLCQRIDRLGSQQLLGIVRALDQAINNTSLILLFEVGKKKLLFPGDAQTESWRYALEEAPEASRNRRALRATGFYKVGHHGSLSGTPRSLWELFDKRSPKKKGAARLETVISTLPGVHGHSSRKTEVPRRSLLDELDHDSTLKRTDALKSSELYLESDV